jgi:hypothetical protein
VWRLHTRRTRVETYARAKIQQQNFGSPPSTAISQVTPNETRASNTTRLSATTPTDHNSQTAPTCTPQGERNLAPVVSAVIRVVEEHFGMTLPGGATDPDSRPLLALPALA